jgi:hypothetical protein
MSSNQPVAVLLCGDFRAWPKAAEYIFNFIEHYYSNIDYYFVTWSTTRDHWWPEEKSINTIRDVTESDVTSKFVNKKLVDYKILSLDTVPKHHVSFFYQSHLSKIGNILKRKYELANNMVYDQVIELRPDLYIPIIVDKITPCGDFTYSISKLHYPIHGELPYLTDMYFRTNSMGNDILGARNFYNKFYTVSKFSDLCFFPGYETMPGTYDVHWILVDYIFKRRMIDDFSKNHEALHATVIRPNFPDNLHDYNIDHIRTLSHDWQKIQWAK